MWNLHVLVLSAVLTSAWGQLGERPLTSDERRSRVDTSKVGSEEDDLGSRVTSWRGQVDVFRVWRPRNWLALEDTYLGCLSHDNTYNGTVMHVNLTEISKLHNGQSRTQACYQLCLNKMAFAGFIAVSFGNRGVLDRCGCYYEYHLDFVFEDDDATCDGSTSHSRIYCGPGNIECFSRAGGLGGGTPTWLFSLALLMSSAHFFVWSR
ncbi:uncharacterized protein LOC122243095 isoform X1 [Penaeus japonicus]|uniref:uncharacterized protein LOC122243095 isoform X1 n=1 Tax=Penaeus japonicus TaxID=27405 RepID=UPI001C71013B|nr:uncharacterized protein LOC122243095 isoform X1 [Penaeus japonicus]XP_042856499.1 uncharacterized protein LOC122243095 isoform X2 [Penaeus japonicus]XP_042856500.1 uncharacterized protein LOC122243095 isoform X1 [Penaeus japonicus]